MSPSGSTSSRAPAGVPPSGNGKYVAIVVLLLAGIGGLVVSKSCGNKPQAVAAMPMTSTPASALDPKMDDVPPPPPDIPDNRTPDSGVKTTVSSLSGCEARACGGSSTDELAAALQFRAKQAHRCYDTALAQDTTLHGRVSLQVRIAANGALCSAAVQSNDMGTPSVAQCVANMFRQSRSFPAPRGGCVEVAVPMNFVPGGK
jgi:hypothetical protein